jgi:hypothetical protein
VVASNLPRSVNSVATTAREPTMICSSLSSGSFTCEAQAGGVGAGCGHRLRS